MKILNWLNSKKSVYRDEYLGVLTWNTSSPRVKLNKSADGLEISIRWILDEQFRTQVNWSQKLAHIMYPNTFEKESAEIPLQVNPTTLFAQTELPNPYQPTSVITRNLLDTESKRKTELPELWKQLLLVHPSSVVVTSLLKAPVVLDGFDVLFAMAGLMICAHCCPAKIP